MGADICLDDSFDSGISGYRGTRSVIRLNQPAISDGGETGATASHPPGTADGLTQSLTVPFEPQVSLPESLSILFVDDDMITGLFHLEGHLRIKRRDGPKAHRHTEFRHYLYGSIRK